MRFYFYKIYWKFSSFVFNRCTQLLPVTTNEFNSRYWIYPFAYLNVSELDSGMSQICYASHVKFHWHYFPLFPLVQLLWQFAKVVWHTVKYSSFILRWLLFSHSARYDTHVGGWNEMNYDWITFSIWMRLNWVNVFLIIMEWKIF